MKEFRIVVEIFFRRQTKTEAGREAKRIFADVDNVVAEQNDPKNTIINLSLFNDRLPGARGIMRMITTERVK